VKKSLLCGESVFFEGSDADPNVEEEELKVGGSERGRELAGHFRP
jgi:hypothetical protein